MQPATCNARVPLGRWLLTQRDRGDWVEGIADAARADRTFPKEWRSGKRCVLTLGSSMPDGDVFAAVDDAEGDWMAA